MIFHTLKVFFRHFNIKTIFLATKLLNLFNILESFTIALGSISPRSEIENYVEDSSCRCANGDGDIL